MLNKVLFCILRAYIVIQIQNKAKIQFCKNPFKDNYKNNGYSYIISLK
jgi:hypothetical protein